jgi:hypothetical protein
MRRYFKRVFRLSNTTSNLVFYGELDVLSFQHVFAKEALNYLWRLYHADRTSIVGLFFQQLSLRSSLRNPSSRTRKLTYVEYVHKLSQHYGISFSGISRDTKQEWDSYIRAHIRNKAISEWKHELGSSVVLSYCFSHLKDNPSGDTYQLSRDGYTARLIFKLRSGSNPLAESTGRYERVPREERLCQLCAIETEDAAHFCTRCPKLANIRSQYLNQLFDISRQVPSPDRHTLEIALSDLHPLDMLRLLLCAYKKLSFIQWPIIKKWWRRLEPSITRASMNTVYLMYTERLNILYKNPIVLAAQAVK